MYLAPTIFLLLGIQLSTSTPEGIVERVGGWCLMWWAGTVGSPALRLRWQQPSEESFWPNRCRWRRASPCGGGTDSRQVLQEWEEERKKGGREEEEREFPVVVDALWKMKCGWECQRQGRMLVFMLLFLFVCVHASVWQRQCFSRLGEDGDSEKASLRRWPDQRLEWWDTAIMPRSVGRTFQQREQTPGILSEIPHTCCVSMVSLRHKWVSQVWVVFTRI